MAAKAPAAFLKLVGADSVTTQAPGDFIPPKTSVISSGKPSGTTTKNWAYYQKMLKDNPKQYHDKTTQLEMYKLAMVAGDDFYKR